MKLFMVIYLLVSVDLIFCQIEEVQLANHFGGGFTYKVAEDRVSKKLEDISKYSFNELTNNSKWQYHLIVSSCKLYLDMDSSLYHFNEANRIDSYATCNVMRAQHNTFVDLLEQSKLTGLENEYIKVIKEETGDSIFSWYLWDLPDFDEFAFIDSCNLKYPPKQLKPKKKATSAISEMIEERDQKYRSTGDLDKQQVLDQINRDYIDSLYNSRGSLTEFEEEEIYQFSIVAHHSEDCDWVYQWTERLIDHQVNGYKGKILLGPLLDRMLNPQKGYCTRQDVQKRDYFVSMLGDKYPGLLEKMHLSW